MFVRSMTVGPFGVNCFIVGCEEKRDCVIIDPGDEADRILQKVNSEKLAVVAIILTHCHIDHVGGVEQLKRITGAPFYIHRAEQPLLNAVGQQAMLFGLPMITAPPPDSFLKEGDTVTVGSGSLNVLETPGHSPGSISLHGESFVIVGDLIFAGSVGRTDLFGGSFDTLRHSIEEKILVLNDETIIYCGHGPQTTVGQERVYNPFLQ